MFIFLKESVFAPVCLAAFCAYHAASEALDEYWLALEEYKKSGRKNEVRRTIVTKSTDIILLHPKN